MWPPEHAVITGASSGIGRAMAVASGGTGTTLTLTGRNALRLGEAADQCRAKGSVVETLVMDVRDREGMAGAMGTLFERRPVDLLVANAGVSGAGR
ncbi:MAG: SDR family NAD(P)-dependent oxidoreductase [Geminicoccaceae bacterium]